LFYPLGALFSSFNQFVWPVIIRASAAMKQRILPLIASLAIASSVLLSSGCKKHHRVAKTPPAPQPRNVALPPQLSKAPSKSVRKSLAVSVGYTEEGIASWYGVPYHGRQAADGEIYDMETLVAAHRVMPFNTWLKITNLANNKSVNVRIIDRGPFVEGRIVDLSKAAARQIGLLGPGIGRVRLEVTGAPPDIPSNDFYAVQVGAFSVAANAERVRMQYAQRFGTAQMAVKQGPVPLWRVLIGKEPSIAAAQELANVLSAENRAVFVVRLDETVMKAGTTVPGLMPETMR
jgi:rare lipoprotein A